MIEKRSMQRFNLKLPVFLTEKDPMQEKAVKEFVTSNICSGGAYILTSEPYLAGDEVEVGLPWPPEAIKNALKLDNNRKRFITLSGHVVRSSEKGFAVRFDPFVEFLSDK